MVFRNLIFQPEVVEQRFRAVVLSHHDQQDSDDQNQTEHGQMLSSSMLLLNLILLIDLTFSTPTPVINPLLPVCPSTVNDGGGARHSALHPSADQVLLPPRGYS